jgi:putative ABC transport system permease protein
VLRTELLRDSGVINAACSQNSPFNGSSGWEINWEGSQVGDKINSRYNYVTYDFIETYKMKIVKGRNFSREFSTDKNACIINETLAKTIGWKNPIGKRIIDNKMTVIGMVKDFHPWGVHDRIPPYFMMLHERRPNYCELFSVRISPQAAGSTLEFVNKTLHDFYPESIFEVRYFDHNLDKEGMEIWIGVGNTFKFFTFLAILIAIIGLFGLVSFATVRRSKEISIRKVLGATISTIYTMVVREFLFLLIIATLIGLPIAYLVVQSSPGAYKYQPGVLDYALPALMIFLVAVLTTGYKAIKAATANPVDSLRDE